MKVLKIGGSVITRKSGYREPDAENIKRMAQAVAAIWNSGVRDFVLVHGAGSFGHPLVLRHGIGNGVKTEQQKLGFADTHESCSELSSFFIKALLEEGVPAVSIPPASIIVQKNKRIVGFGSIVRDYLGRGFLPVLHGDVVPDTALGGSVCSGDQIVAYLGRDAEFVVLATNVDGVLDDKGKLVERITAASFPGISKHLKPSAGDVTGAMAGKIRELLALDTTSFIVNAAYPERIEALMKGRKTVCTEVRK